MFIKSNKLEAGFSLVELMVVVAIIGVLSMIAVPKVQGYLAKAKQTEAHSNLGIVYTGEMNYFTDYNTYGTMANINFPFQGTYNYATGFNNDSTYSACTGTTCKRSPSLTADIGDTSCKVDNVAVPATFKACSRAKLNNIDFWSIDQNKVLTNISSGI